MPVDTLLGQQARRPSKWRSLLAWRDWRLPTKLAAITFVPLLIAVILGTIAIVDQAKESARSDRTEQLVSLGSRTQTLLGDIQHERALTAEQLTSGVPGGSQELTAASGAVDGGVAQLNAGVRELESEPGGRVDERAAEARTELGKLSGIREQVAAGQLDAAAAIAAYSGITEALLDLHTAIVAGIDSGELAATPSALHNVLIAGEMVSIERSLVGYGIERSALPPSELDRLARLETRFGERIADFRLVASEQQLATFTEVVPGDALDTRRQLISDALRTNPTDDAAAMAAISAQQWQDSSSAVLAGLDELAAGLDTALGEAASERAGEATGAVVALAIALLFAFALAAAVGFVISRQLLRSLRQLRSSALDIATERLPAVVRSIQQGEKANTDIDTVPVRTADEVGEVARAFDEVHGQAVHLAAEQAAMRTSYGNVFVNLSRRSQSLVQRQLQMIERLERDEEDADQLATLFQLDHLATRMRRNNENLLVLSGGESGRRSGQPVTVTDVLRAAVSEIEQYQRVAVRTAPDTRVVGHAASDLMRLLAELLDNATAFSAPDTHVTLATRYTDDRSLSIDVLDKGIGMNASEVSAANTRIVEAASVDLATSRRMGLFVVGRLAAKHGFRVVLYGGKDITGVRANVLIPANLLAGAPGPAPGPLAEQQPTTGGGALPKRNRALNGSGASAIARRLPGSHGNAAEGGAAGESGEAAVAEPAPLAGEVSGTALFTPIGSEESAAESATQAGPEPASSDAAEPPDTTEEHSAAEAHVAADGYDDDVATRDGQELHAPAQQAVAGGADAPAASATGARDDLPVGTELFAANGTPLTQWWAAAAKAQDEAEQSEQPQQTQQAQQAGGESVSETTPIFNQMLSAWFRAESPPLEREQQPERERAEDTGAERANRWDFAVDESWRTVETVSRSEPKNYTQAGLPRRRSGEQLLPGSAAQDDVAAAPRPPSATSNGTRSDRQLPVRDPADIRGRLSSFQRGVHQGKRQRGSEETEAAESAAPATEQPATELPATEQPANYTSAGLPRRRRGEQLLPGSASRAESVPGPRSERDPNDVRGRLSSFQQGIRRGRHQTTQSSDGNQERMEGE